ncbi:putative transcriptional regulator [Candidatus Parcubacteria bacterium]|nr:putative transcriptional regulator [Candidatus Parcubacteria bacterium]
MSKPILDNLFGSKVRVKVLKYLFRNASRDFSIHELAKRVQEPFDQTKQEVNLLKDLGIVRRKR